ncbi:MAG: LysM peptidoglycan-binding domain-containing protein [Clostridia bacterium]|nr:LysM peptidoglycan-binding domain-containing protein [Clostridia bacterium]
MIVYTVERGDSLYEIAKRLGADADLIARDNELREPSELTVGQNLVVRMPQRVHRVSEGENIYSVAQNYGVTVNQLWRENPHLAGGTALAAGDTLVIEEEEPQYDREIAVNAFVYPSVNKEILRKTLPYLTYLTVFSYGIEEDGELTEIDDEELINLAREYGTAPLMMISNLTPEGNYSPELVGLILSDNDIQNILIGGIVRTVADKRYSGVVLDLEYIPAELTEAYSDFLSRLNEKLGSGGYPIFVLASPVCEGEESGMLCEGLDYESVGGTADGLMLQTYGWGYAYGEPMAISPADKVGEALKYAVDKVVPERLFLGMPSYGYNWALPYESGVSRATPIANADAPDLAAKKHAAIEYDTASEAPFFKYYDMQSDTPREHEVWFGDARSAQTMLESVNKFGLGGVSVWNAMRYFPQLWQLINRAYKIKKVLR